MIWPLSTEWSLTLLVILLAVSFALGVADLVWLQSRRNKRIARMAADHIWARFVELERAEGEESARSFENVRSTVARAVARAAEGPQERPEEPPATDEAEDGPEDLTDAFSPDVPRFGQPEKLIYDPAVYEPLQCSIESGRCGGRSLRAGEEFFRIPDPFAPDEPFVVVCTEDVTAVTAKFAALERKPGTMIEPNLGKT